MAQKTIVGLDIGTTRLRAVEAIMIGGKPKVIGIASTGLAEGAVVGGEIEDTTAFADALKVLWQNGKFTAKDARVVMNSERNIARLATLSDEVDFNKTLPFTLKNKMNLSSADYYISFHTLRKYEIQEEDKTSNTGYKTVPKRNIFLAAAPRKIVDSILNSFAKTDLRILSIDLATLSIIRAESNDSELTDKEEVDVHVNVGGDTTTVVVSRNAQPVYVRIIDLGGNAITDSIADQLEISLDEAEKLKIKTLDMNPSLLQRPLETGSFFQDPNSEIEDRNDEYSVNELDAYEIVNDQLAAIINNITTTIIHFIDNNNFDIGDEIDHVYISGGTAAFSKIRHHLIHEVGAKETTLSSPLTKMMEKSLIDKKLMEQFAPVEHEFTLAVGAILGTGGEKDA